MRVIHKTLGTICISRSTQFSKYCRDIRWVSVALSWVPIETLGVVRLILAGISQEPVTDPSVVRNNFHSAQTEKSTIRNPTGGHPKSIKHISNIVPREFREAFNWAPIIPRDESSSGGGGGNNKKISGRTFRHWHKKNSAIATCCTLHCLLSLLQTGKTTANRI